MPLIKKNYHRLFRNVVTHSGPHINIKKNWKSRIYIYIYILLWWDSALSNLTGPGPISNQWINVCAMPTNPIRKQSVDTIVGRIAYSFFNPLSVLVNGQNKDRRSMLLRFSAYKNSRFSFVRRLLETWRATFM